MNFKNIISTTRNFILIVLFVIIFKSIFGDENTLIGVTTITAMLLFLSKDLTLEPIKNTTFLVIFNVLLGLFAYYAESNIFLGIILNFIAIFVTAFIFSSDLKAPSYIAFTLQYLFMLANPITIDKLPVRLSALFFGALAIMIMQFISNRNRVSRYGNSILKGICELILNKLRLINHKEDFLPLESQINSSIYSFKKFIYEERQRDFYLTKEARIQLDLVLSLNKLNLLINKLQATKEFDQVRDDIIIAIDNIKICFDNPSYLNSLDELFNSTYKKYEGINTKNTYILKFLNTLNFIYNSLSQLSNFENKSKYLNRNTEKTPEKYTLLNIYKNNLTKNSLRFSFAFRFAIGVVIGAFITDFFKLSEGRWLYFTIGALSQPQYELSQQKSKDRIFATLIGTLIISILFDLITNTTLRSLVIIAAGYFGSYIKQYKYNMIFTTISAVGSAALLSNATVLSISRIFYVILGMIIAMLLARFVFPYRIKDANNNLISIYVNSLREMLIEVNNSLQTNINDHIIKNLLLITGLIEDKLITNNSAKENTELNLLIEEGRILGLNIYELYEWTNTNHLDKKSITELIDELKILTSENKKFNEMQYNYLLSKLEETDNIKTRIAINNIIEIFLGLKTISTINISL